MEHTKEKLTTSRSSEFYRYLGLLAIVRELPTTDEYLRRQVETELAESLDAEMGTHENPVPMQVINGHIYGSGQDMTESALGWAVSQYERAKQDKNLEWFSLIAQSELQEYLDLAEFYKTAQKGDVMVVVSPFPEEAYANDSTKQYVKPEGFKVDSRRSFIRAYEMSNDGMLVHVQSVDTSDLNIWNEVLGRFNIVPADDTADLLSNRLYVSKTSGRQIITQIANNYDDQLFLRTGEQHSFGRIKGGSAEANSFVWQNPVIIEDTIRELQEVTTLNPTIANQRAERILYNSKALINDMFNNPGNYHNFIGGYSDVREARETQGQQASLQGKTFSGCSGSSVPTETITNTESLQAVLNSFSRKNGVEIHDCVTCPHCGNKGGARDPKLGWACFKTSCKGYNELVIGRAKQSFFSSLQDTFGDMLSELFSAKKQKIKR